MILDVLLIILISVLLFILLLLFFPFTYSIKLANNKNCFYCGAKVRWLFGLFQLGYSNKQLFYIKVFGRSIKIKSKKTAQKQKIEENEKKGRTRVKKRKMTKKGVKYIVHCLKKVLKKYKPKKFVISGELGFEDPGITGFVHGLSSFFSIPMDMEKFRFRYDEEIYNGTIYTDGTFALYYLVFIFLKLILYKPARLVLR
ncbi:MULTISPECIES: hypothetical protein [Psychrilyobacter]|uniref:DUF2953 domain-containing protein n=1 Tax=Psychrilyobacter piezotolerans TaxID=2293438 RepID=A0ABX9KLM8_9FUSO|nr:MULTISPECIES: hypothetical protein [Psychrilyobacter]MCS5422611.1 hypothetical protein [Psychrilyobacter sp. S5]NDI76487.1 hypothetical protein [Psychrilyobacter piezotolerans]RDE66079.1 hypothetical protein DV867_00975 [Psychrilyobacter sp. S5]REI43257.1 hypothetical protein DYH56_00975 [Psychrilyobacter piezotolerans]